MSESCLESKETGPGLQIVSYSLILYLQELGCLDLAVFTATFGSTSFSDDELPEGAITRPSQVRTILAGKGQ